MSVTCNGASKSDGAILLSIELARFLEEEEKVSYF